MVPHDKPALVNADHLFMHIFFPIILNSQLPGSGSKADLSRKIGDVDFLREEKICFDYTIFGFPLNLHLLLCFKTIPHDKPALVNADHLFMHNLKSKSPRILTSQLIGSGILDT